MPSGAIGCCGRIPSRVATSVVGRRWMSSPSSSTLPPLGLSSRARPRSSVDLPQALAPTITVIWPGGDGEREAVDHDAVVVGEADVVGGQGGRGRWVRSWVLGGQPPAPIRLARARRNRRYGRAEDGGDDPDGQLGRARRSAGRRGRRRPAGAPRRRRTAAGRASGRRPAGGRSAARRGRRTRSGRPTRWRRRPARWRLSSSAPRDRSTRAPRPVAASSPSSSRRSWRARAIGDRQQHQQRQRRPGGRAPSRARSGCR